MTPFIDVNIWLYLANPSSPFHSAAVAAVAPHVEGGQPFAVSWQVFYEFIRVATDPRLYVQPCKWRVACDFIAAVFQNPAAQILTERSTHRGALEFVMQESQYVRGHFIHGCHIAALLYEYGIRTIITADQDFLRFPFLLVVNPT